MNIQMITQNQSNDLALMGGDLTMSSREIAELTGKRHGDVMRDTRQMLEALGEDQRRFASMYKDSYGREQSQYELNKELTLTLLLGYDVKARLKVVRRWQELETQLSTPQLPDFTNPALAARAWADAIEQQQAAQQQLEAAKPAVQFVERYVDSRGLMTFREVCKTLQVKENVFREFLHTKKIMYVLNGNWVPHQNHLDAGRFSVKTGTSDINGHAYTSAKFTPKGVEWVAGEWAKSQIQAGGKR